MLNQFFKFILLGLVVLAFTSCEETTDILAPSSSFTVSVDEDATYTTNNFEVGEVVKVSVDITADDGITIFGIDKVVNGGAAQALTLNTTPAPGATNFSADYDITVTEAVGSSVQIIVKATAGNGNTFTTDTYTYNVVAQGQGGGGGVFPLLRSQITVGLGAQGSTLGSYLNTSTGTVYLSSEVNSLSNAEKAAIDITFGVLAAADGGGPTIISPDARTSFTVPFNNPMGDQASTTTFKTDALTDIDAVTSSDVENDVDHTSGSAAFIGISSGSVYSFINEAGAKGYFKVTSITGSGDARVANLDVLVQTIQ